MGLGLPLLVSFSAGLAMMLMAVGAIGLYARNLLPERKLSKPNSVLPYVPVASAAIVTVVEVIMTEISLGLIGRAVDNRLAKRQPRSVRKPAEASAPQC